jgi:hypothetical protein
MQMAPPPSRIVNPGANAQAAIGGARRKNAKTA